MAETIQFVAKDRTGTPISGGSIDVTGAYAYGTDFSQERWNQVSRRTLDGTKQVYDNGVELVTVTMFIKGVLKANGSAFKDWFINKLVYQLNQFDVNLNGEPIDLGKGEGVDLTECDFTKSNINGVFTSKAPGIYDVKFNFEYLI